MENKGFGNFGAALLGVIACWRLLFAPGAYQFVDFVTKSAGALVLIFLSCLANSLAKDLYQNRIKPKLFRNDRTKERDADEKAA